MCVLRPAESPSRPFGYEARPGWGKRDQPNLSKQTSNTSHIRPGQSIDLTQASGTSVRYSRVPVLLLPGWMGNGGQARCKSCKSGMAWCATLASVQQQGRYDDPVPSAPDGRTLFRTSTSTFGVQGESQICSDTRRFNRRVFLYFLIFL